MSGRPVGKRVVLSSQPPAASSWRRPRGTLPAAALLSRPEPTQGPCALRLAARTPPREAQRWPRLRGCSRWPSEGRDLATADARHLPSQKTRRPVGSPPAAGPGGVPVSARSLTCAKGAEERDSRVPSRNLRLQPSSPEVPTSDAFSAGRLASVRRAGGVRALRGEESWPD